MQELSNKKEEKDKALRLFKKEPRQIRSGAKGKGYQEIQEESRKERT